MIAARRNVTVTPSRLDWMMAGMVGVARRLTGRARGLDQDNANSGASNWNTEINGAIAELVASRYYGVPWELGYVSPLDPVSREFFKKPDCGPYQVRATDYRSGHLIVRPNDNDMNAPYVLVIVEPGGDCVLVGRKKCRDARQDPYWRGDKNSWWVPQSDLEDL